MPSPTLISLLGFASTLLGIVIQSIIAIRVATLNRRVQEVHIAVNSERTALLLKFDELTARYNILVGANAERAKSDDHAATFEAGRQQGNDEKAPV
jgi:hypothetical protein